MLEIFWTWFKKQDEYSCQCHSYTYLNRFHSYTWILNTNLEKHIHMYFGMHTTRWYDRTWYDYTIFAHRLFKQDENLTTNGCIYEKGSFLDIPIRTISIQHFGTEAHIFTHKTKWSNGLTITPKSCQFLGLILLQSSMSID